MPILHYHMVAINFTCSLLLSSIHYAVRRSHYHGYFIINIISRKEVYCEVNLPARARGDPLPHHNSRSRSRYATRAPHHTAPTFTHTQSHARGSVCYPPQSGLLGQCGSTSNPSSGLECNCFTILVRGVPEEICSCEPKSRYLDTVCNKDSVGTCGSALYPDPSGLTCQCEVFGPKETCTCRPAVV